jgi:hypothetical protein
VATYGTLRLAALFAIGHLVASGLGQWQAAAAARDRAATGREPGRVDRAVLTLNGVLAAPLSSLIAWTPAAAPLADPPWRHAARGANSLLWGAGLALAVGGRARRPPPPLFPDPPPGTPPAAL